MTEKQPALYSGRDKIDQAKAKTGSKKAQRSAARLLAIQAVFQILSTKHAPDDVVKEYLEYRAGMEIDGDVMIMPDRILFKDIVLGTMTHGEQLDAMVKSNRAAGNASRAEKPIEPLLHAILLCGAFELMVHQSIEAPIIISDYLHAARAFYDDAEIKVVNAVLDGVRATTRI